MSTRRFGVDADLIRHFRTTGDATTSVSATPAATEKSTSAATASSQNGDCDCRTCLTNVASVEVQEFRKANVIATVNVLDDLRSLWWRPFNVHGRMRRVNGPGPIYDCGCEDIPDGQLRLRWQPARRRGECGGDGYGMRIQTPQLRRRTTIRVPFQASSFQWHGGLQGIMEHFDCGCSPVRLSSKVATPVQRIYT